MFLYMYAMHSDQTWVISFSIFLNIYHFFVLGTLELLSSSSLQNL
jgi:hypothetical protein